MTRAQAQVEEIRAWKEIKETMIAALTWALQSKSLRPAETVEASRLLFDLTKGR